MIRALLVFSVGVAAIACELPSEPKPDAESCEYAKEQVWIAAGHQLPVPDSLMQSDHWELSAPWYLGTEVTTFRATAEGCVVRNQ